MRMLQRWLFGAADYRALLYPLAYMAMIFALSSISYEIGEDSPFAGFFIYVPPTLQNLLHIPLYAGLAILWSRALRVWPVPVSRLFVAACALAIGYGILDEWHQSFVPGRFASTTDALLNALGAVLGTWAYVYLSRHRRLLAIEGR